MSLPATKPGLIVVCGLPGVGKTTLARLVAARTGAAYLRIDSIEAALRADRHTDLAGPEGYLAAGAIARDQLALGRLVIADAVNDDAWCHNHWESLAQRAGAACGGAGALLGHG
ncbi:MAG: AAA family ATPase [Pseudomonadota bacterium]